jgi:hypothetical protein
VVLVIAAVLVLSLLWACAKMLRPNDSGGMGRDSYGVRGDGFRGLYEILDALHIPVRRGLAPPRQGGESAYTIALLGPDPQLVLFEPKYLTSLLSWVDGGGRLVVAPAPHKHNWYFDETHKTVPGERDILKLLEVHDVVTLSEHPPSEAVTKERQRNLRDSGRSGSPRNRDFDSEDFWDAFSYSRPAPRGLDVEATGSLAKLAADVHRIAAPGDEFAILEAGAQPPSGTLALKNDDGKKSLLVAVVPRGKGEIVVISDPVLLSNALVAQADNSVLAARVLSPQGEAVDFDEYYHGLAVRGNPLYLLTRPGFAAVAAAILLVIGVVAWRAAIFLGPPLPDLQRSRRGIQEYIHAMGAFFCRGAGHRRFLVREVREGVLHELCEELHLPPHTTNVDTIIAALSRRYPDRAQKLSTVLAEVDGLLDRPGDYPKSSFLPSTQRLAGCL